MENNVQKCFFCGRVANESECMAVLGGLDGGLNEISACSGCVHVYNGRHLLSILGAYHLATRHDREGTVKIKATEVVNENISAELGIPDTKDVITIQCFGPSHDGQWVRRSSYNQLSDEARRRDKQLTLALDRIDDLEKQLTNAGTAMNDQMDLAMKRIGELSMSPGSVELEHQIIRHVEKNGRWVVKLCDDKGVEKEYVIEEKSQ